MNILNLIKQLTLQDIIIADHFNVYFPEIGPRLATNLPVSTLNTPHYLKRKPSSFEFAEIWNRGEVTV